MQEQIMESEKGSAYLGNNANETGSSIFTEEDRAALEDMPADFSMKLLQAMGEAQNQKKE
ncbi:hypothetical protein [Shewanella algae]|uniref:hypothetical protein n=1 Tax=Shewanella algae TaxID=38313 RepID=UPI001BEDDBBA|nr:hypothetical protein [Shewanella algae]BCV28492.1 hypothetical protein TUM3811_23520 [Shewanella algae]